jgi:hypothetical protein
MNKIYLFKDKEVAGGYVFYSPTDKKGVYFGDSNQKSMEEVVIKPERQGKLLTDRLCLISNVLVVSQRFLIVMQKMNNQKIKIVPSVIDIGKELIRNKYYLIYPDEEIDIIDYKNSKLKLYKGHVLSAQKLIAEKNKVPTFDLFYAKSVSWIVSEKFKTIIETQNFSGMRFEEIEMPI